MSSDYYGAQAGELADLGASPTFTDRDLYEALQRHLPMIFWPTWEMAGQEVRAGVARIADDIYGRLRGT